MAKRKKAAKPQAEGRAKPIDGYVGRRVRARRIVLGMTQTTLAKKLGITVQQLQKNEKGFNRIAGSRLLDLSHALNVPIQYFFDDMPKAMQATATGQSYQVTDGTDPDADLLTKAETLNLVRAYYAIENLKVRRRVYALAKALAGDDA